MEERDGIMKIGILSDSHEHTDNIKLAVSALEEAKCEALLFCGDFCAPGTGVLLAEFNGPKHFIFGNNDGDAFNLARVVNNAKDDVSWYPESKGEVEIDGTKIFLTHYPAYARHAAKSGEYELVCFGHDHNARIEGYDGCLSVNSGCLNPMKIRDKNKKPSYAIYDTQTKTATLYALEDNSVLEEKSL